MYIANKERYQHMLYRRCGNSGILLSAISFGLWQNFGSMNPYSNMVEMITTAFDAGITHFDLANNYGPYPGAAEENFGKILKNELLPYRDELIISTKAGYGMWAGPYGDMGSRKYLIASLDQSLKRLGIPYVDIFYHHRRDPNTPLEETMGALCDIVKQGKALYIGISNYNAKATALAIDITNKMGVKLLIHQPRYSMLDQRMNADGLFDVLDNNGVGCIVFSPLAQGLLTNKYLNGIPNDSRAVVGHTSLSKDNITDELLEKIKKLNALAKTRNQNLSQMALSYLLSDERITTVLVGASNKDQLLDNVGCIQNIAFDKNELEQIDQILNG